MRLALLTGLFGLLFILSALLPGCSSEEGEIEISAKENARADSLAKLAADEDLIRSASARLISHFAGGLRSRLGSALQSSGPSGAIKECRLAAPMFADSLSNNLISIRRVTEKYRNPDNRATTAEKEILANFADTTGRAGKFYVEWKTEDSITTHSYYKPIFVKQPCLNCHGDMQTLAPGVYQAVKKTYPLDKATGYNEGDLRGMFIVETIWPDARERAEAILSGEAFKPAPGSEPPIDPAMDSLPDSR